MSSGKIILVLQVVAHQEYQSCFVIGRYCVSYLVVYSLLIFAFYSFGPRKIQRNNCIDMYGFPVHDYPQKQNGSPFFSSIVRKGKCPSLSSKTFVIQQICYHGNVMSHSVSPRLHAWIPLIKGSLNGKPSKRSFTAQSFDCDRPKPS